MQLGEAGEAFVLQGHALGVHERHVEEEHAAHARELCVLRQGQTRVCSTSFLHDRHVVEPEGQHVGGLGERNRQGRDSGSWLRLATSLTVGA